MTAAPPRFPWIVSIHPSADSAPIGAGVVVDHSQVLTCEHVVRPHDEVWVAFPMASPQVPWHERRRVRQVAHDGRAAHNLDVVLLELDEPVPGPVRPARIRLAPHEKLSGRPWWSFGFPHHDPVGNPAHGTVGDQLGYGHVHLDRLSSIGLRPGFSGGPLWSPEYQAVVGLVVHAALSGANEGDGRALSLAHVDDAMPEMKLSVLANWQLEAADEQALAAWGWSLDTDEEARRHWLPRARGVAADAEPGSRFRGRAAALRRINDWLDGPAPAGHPLVVTGSPGVGKSAVLGRVVTTADAGIAAGLDQGDTAERATVGSVACAVHAKGKNALEVATEIAVAASAALPNVPGDLVPHLRDRLSDAHRPGRFNLVIDALDEAVTPAQTRQLIVEVIMPLARHGARLGVQVVVGTRRADDHGDLLAEFGADAEVVDLDSAGYFSESDLADYALVTLQQAGAERAANPYADASRAEPVARRIASLAGGNFLVAGLVARAHGLNDAEPVEPGGVAFTATVADALDTYLGGISPAGATSARLALTALAFAETPGLPLPLWRVAVEALGGRVTAEDLGGFARSSAANFLVETGSARTPVYRLFHQALNEALLASRAATARPHVDERDLLYAWVRHGHATGWDAAPDYLLRSLAQHAARAGLVDTLLNDDGYVLNADLGRLLVAAEVAETREGRARVRLLQRAPQAATAPAAERAALFSVVDRIDQLGSGLHGEDSPYRARWAHTPPRLERTVLEGHSDAVYDVCSVPLDGRGFLASAGEDGTVRLWDPLTSQVVRVLDGHADCVRGVWAVEVEGGTLLATAGHDGTIGIWNAGTGAHLRTLSGHGDWVRNLCAVPVPGGPTLLASAGDDRTVRIWDPVEGTLRHTLTGFGGWVTAVTHLPVGPNGLVASTGFDGVITIWDPVTGACTNAVTAHAGWATTLCAVRVDGAVALASAGYDGVVRMWNPLTGDLLGAIDPAAGPLTDLCTVEVDGTVLLAATDEDGVLHLWDARDGEPRPSLHGDVSWIRAVCALRVRDRNLLATAGDDGTVRLWDPLTRQTESVMDDGRLGPVAAVCAVPWQGGTAVGSSGADGTVRVWDPVSGDLLDTLAVHDAAITGVCVVADPESPLLVAGGDDHVVRVWDLREGAPGYELSDHHERVNAVCPVEAGGRLLVATGADDATVRLWNPHNGTAYGVLLGHRNWVTALTTATLDDRQVLASADKDGTVRLWDPDGATLWQQLTHTDAVNALCTVTVNDREFLVSGSADRTIRLWHPADGKPHHVLGGHTAPVTGVCAMPLGDRELVVSTSLDRTVRLWDPVTARCVRTIPVHHRALACAYVAGTLVLGLDRGLLALVVAD